MTDTSTKYLKARLTLYDPKLGPPKQLPRECYCRCTFEPARVYANGQLIGQNITVQMQQLVEQWKKVGDSMAQAVQLYERICNLRATGLLSAEDLDEISKKAQEKSDPIFLLDQITAAVLSINSHKLADIAAHLDSKKLQELSEKLRGMARYEPFGAGILDTIPKPQNRAERRQKAVGRKGGEAGKRKNWERKTYFD